MKKKVMMIGAGLTIGSALLVTSAFANIGGAGGYEAYKSAIKHTAAAASATHHIALSVQDNGNTLMTATTTVKENEAAGGVSGQAVIQAGSASQTFDFYNQAGKHVFKAGDSDTYYVGSDSGWEHRKGHAPKDAEFGKAMENVIDALVGNLKNHVNLSQSSDGEQAVDMKLTGSQIPAAANIIGSVLVKEALNAHSEQDLQDMQSPDHNLLGLDMKQIAASAPKLTDDINIDEVALHAAIDGDNYLNSQEIDFTITGKDAAGQAHKVVIRVDMDLANIDATTPDQIDLTGKKTAAIPDEHGSR